MMNFLLCEFYFNVFKKGKPLLQGMLRAELWDVEFALSNFFTRRGKLLSKAVAAICTLTTVNERFCLFTSTPTPHAQEKSKRENNSELNCGYKPQVTV